MSNLTISELRSIVKGRNIDGWQNLSKKELEDLLPKPKKKNWLRKDRLQKMFGIIGE